MTYADTMLAWIEARAMKYSTPREWLSVHAWRVEQMRARLTSRAPSRSERPAQDCPPPADSWAVRGI